MSEETLVNLGGQDWDDIVAAARHAEAGERIVVNMGPQHPSTHGVLRADPGDRRRNSHQRPVRNRLSAHRNRKEPGIPQLDAGRHVRDPDGITCHRSSTRRRTAPGVEAPLASRTQSRSAPV